jgi:UDP-N-acetyl-2-amino-2-deoxyglucuronate dehydrogenase
VEEKAHMKKEERVGMAVIGCGRIGRTHIESIKELGEIAFLAAVVDTEKDLARQTGEKYGTPFYTSIEEALGDPRVGAIVICLPHDLHTPVSIKAIENGKHVLVEKPFALSVKDAEQMMQAARAKNLIIMAGQSFRYFSGLQEAKRRMKSEMGEPFNLLYTLAVYFDTRKAPPWWKSGKKTGGLVLPMLGSHTVDATLWLFEGKVPERVYAEAASWNPDFEGPDEATIFIRFKDGAMATNYLSVNTRPSKQECLVVGPKGRMHFRHGDTSIGLVGTGSIELSIGEEVVPEDPQKSNNIKQEEQNFIESILGKSEPMVKPKEILFQMKIMEAARESIKKNKAVEI